MANPIDMDIVLGATGFSDCYFDTKGERCEGCEEIREELFFGHADYWDSREGEYLCEVCLRKIYEENGLDQCP